jgi:NADH-quinone oxidoreductase subunit J
VVHSLFVVMAVLGLLAALGTVLARNLVHAALYLIAYFFIVACVFVLLEAEFLAAIQVLVYIGAVAILMMFGIMLTRNVQGDDTTSVPKGWVWPGLGAALVLFGVLAFGINRHAPWSGAVQRPSTTAAIGEKAAARGRAINDMGRTVGTELLTRYAVAFEVAGLLLTAALVGAVALAHRDPEDDADGRRAVAARAAGSGGNGLGNGQSHDVAGEVAAGGVR